MGIVIIIGILVVIGITFYGGYRLGQFFIEKENDTLRTQLMFQERFSRTWAAEATDKYTLSYQVAAQQKTNLTETMQTVIQLLSAYQLQNTGNTPQLQHEKVSELIARAKAIGTLHE